MFDKAIRNTDNPCQNIDIDNSTSIGATSMEDTATKKEKSKTKLMVTNNFKSASGEEVKEAVVKSIVRLIVSECERGGRFSC